MENYVKAYSIGEAWILAIKTVLAKGTKIENSDSILEVVPLFIEINQPSLADKIVEEFGDKKYLDFLAKNFQDFSPVENWGYSYAQRLYSFNEKSQIVEVIGKLSENLYSKSATISLLLNEQDKNHKPCLTTLDFKIRANNLIINAFFRSQDIGKKMYGDALELVKIGNIMLKRLPAKGIILILTICSAHIYLNDLEKVELIIRSTE